MAASPKPNYGNNMLLTSSLYKDVPTIKMIPATTECPYIEAFVDRFVGYLVVISKIEKEMATMLPRLDESGELIRSKRPKMNGKDYQEVRAIIHTFQEFYIMEPAEIENFIKAFAINADSFKYDDLITVIESKPKAIIQNESVILDEAGIPLEKK